MTFPGPRPAAASDDDAPSTPRPVAPDAPSSPVAAPAHAAPGASGNAAAPSPSPERLALEAGLRALGSVLVAYSGGIDSALVLRVATEVLGPDRALGVTAVGPALPARERTAAGRLAQQMGARHRFVDAREIDQPGYQANAPDRCFHCKSALYRVTEAVRREEGLAWVVNGTNTDDLGDYRPGLDAARAAGARSPLVDAGLGKAAVRAVARELGLEVWDKPASACLSSRIPYGTPVTREDALRGLGLRDLRVRHHGDVARVEVGTGELETAFALRDRIVAAGRAAGFTFVALDLEGYRTGSLNAVLHVLT